MDLNKNANHKIATFGTGCFWCTEAVFQAVEGVISAVSGYAGGFVENPSYEAVCAGTTGHAECIQVTYDSTVITLEELLEIFWRVHDPTTPNRQGNDVGSQYHSTIFYHDETQKAIIEKSLKDTDASELWPNPIVTTIKPLEIFYPAEDYHQEYYERVGDRNPYCTYIIKPKVDKLKKEFKDKLKK